MINFIDLFAGCGGLTEGFYKQGYNALAHAEGSLLLGMVTSAHLLLQRRDKLLHLIYFRMEIES